MPDNGDFNNATAVPEQNVSFLAALICGGMAGTSVDVALFPIDTLKTRLQSPQGFIKAGGFHGIYNGLGAAAIGSAPGAALFFSTYEVREAVSMMCLFYYTGCSAHLVAIFLTHRNCSSLVAKNRL